MFTFDDGDSTTIGPNPCINSSPIGSAMGIKFLSHNMMKSLSYQNGVANWTQNLVYDFIKPSVNQTNYIYPNGESDILAFTPPLWQSDVRMIGSLAPFTFSSNSNFCVDLAYVYYQNDTLRNIENVINLLYATDTVQDFYDNVNLSCVGFLTSKEGNTIKKITSSCYPNPALEQVTILFSRDLINTEISLKNALGQEVRSIYVTNLSEVQLNRESLESGIYFYSIMENSIVIGSGKVLFE